MKYKKWIIISGSLLIILGVLIILGLDIIPAQTRGARRPALSQSQTAAAIIINDEAIGSDTVISLANTFLSDGVTDKAEAYQNAVNLLVQNTLFLQEATRMGLTPTDAEVNTRVEQLLDDAAKENQSLRERYITQAAALGTTWDSPEFKAYLLGLTKKYLPAEKLNARLDSETNGDQQKFNTEKAHLLTDLLAKATIVLDTSSLPADAKKLHLPTTSELPVVANLPAFPQTTP